jgi:hypothetical protein
MGAEERFLERVALIERLRVERPAWFDLIGPPASSQDVIRAETELGCVLPDSYRRFVTTVGAGDFVFTAIYSPSPGSDYPLVQANRDPWMQARVFVAFADNGCGDYYGWAVTHGRATEPVMLLDHETNRLRGTDFADFLEFVEHVGLHPR